VLHWLRTARLCPVVPPGVSPPDWYGDFLVWLGSKRIAPNGQTRLGMNREMVHRYLRLAKPTISIAGVGSGRRSRCEGLVEVIARKLEADLGTRRIYQAL
jgi:hypothetical protein